MLHKGLGFELGFIGCVEFERQKIVQGYREYIPRLYMEIGKGISIVIYRYSYRCNCRYTDRNRILTVATEIMA